jgi:hypothetical protein
MLRLKAMMLACSPLLYSGAQAQPPAGQPLSAQQFSDVMRAAWAPVTSASFVYEGNVTYSGPVSKHYKGASNFQGVYAFKNNKSVFLDLYFQRADQPFLHTTMSLAAGKDYEVNRSTPDVEGADGNVVKQPGSLLNFFVEATPESFLGYSHLRLHMDDPARWGYEFLGWETVDGHDCLKVSFTSGKAPSPDRPNNGVLKEIYWFDLTRGGHFLRHDVMRDEDLMGRTSQVELRQCVDGERHYWMPFTGTSESFFWANEYHSRPVIVTKYEVVDGSMRLNLDIPDDLFRAGRRNGVSPMYKALGLASPQNRFAPGSGEAKPEATKKTEVPAGPIHVSQRLDNLLAEAESQSQMLEASGRPTAWPASRLASYGLSGTGIVALLGAVYLRRRAA